MAVDVRQNPVNKNERSLKMHSQHQLQLLATHLNNVATAVAELHRRVDATSAAAPVPAPPSPPPPPPQIDEAELTSRILASVSGEVAKVREEVAKVRDSVAVCASAEAKAAAVRERTALEAMLTHRVEQLTTKLVRERVAQATEELKQELADRAPAPVQDLAAADDISIPGLDEVTLSAASPPSTAPAKRGAGGKGGKKAAPTAAPSGTGAGT